MSIFDIKAFLKEAYEKKADIEITYREHNGYCWITKGKTVIPFVSSDDEDYTEGNEDLWDCNGDDPASVEDFAFELFNITECGNTICLINCRNN